MNQILKCRISVTELTDFQPFTDEIVTYVMRSSARTAVREVDLVTMIEFAVIFDI